MLTNQFDNLNTRFNEAKNKLRALEEDLTLNPKGFIYKEKHAQLTRTLRELMNRMKSLGCDVSVITVTADIYKENILHSLAIQFSGISVMDALSIFKLRYPASFNHRHKIIYTGKAILTPLINKSEFQEKRNTDGNY